MYYYFIINKLLLAGSGNRSHPSIFLIITARAVMIITYDYDNYQATARRGERT